MNYLLFNLFSSWIWIRWSLSNQKSTKRLKSLPERSIKVTATLYPIVNILLLLPNTWPPSTRWTIGWTWHYNVFKHLMKFPWLEPCFRDFTWHIIFCCFNLRVEWKFLKSSNAITQLLSVTCARSVVFSGYCGFLHQ